MSRKKKILAVMTVLLLFLGDYLYWTCSFPLGQAVPDEDWNRAQLWYYDEFFDAHEVEVDVGLLSEILTLVEKEKVTNRPRFRTMSQPYFMLYVYYEEGYPCSFTIVENGDIPSLPNWIPSTANTSMAEKNSIKRCWLSFSKL